MTTPPAEDQAAPAVELMRERIRIGVPVPTDIARGVLAEYNRRSTDLFQLERRVEMLTAGAAPLSPREPLRVILHYIATGEVTRVCDDALCLTCSRPIADIRVRCARAVVR